MILKKCRVCKSGQLRPIFNLKNQPLANNLSSKIDQKVKLYPLKLMFCKRCKNAQLSIVVNNKKLFGNYFYKSSISSTLEKHFSKAANTYIKKFKLNKLSKILDIGSNDGIGLIPFKKKKIKNLYGVEPAKNLYKITKKLNIKTYNSFLNQKIASKNLNKFDLIMASNVFAHVDKIEYLAKNTFKMLKRRGVFVIEVQYFPRMLIDGSFDNIYHEHVNYWCLSSLINFFNLINATVFDAEMINTHGGSIRIYVKKNSNQYLRITRNINLILKYEKQIGIGKMKTFKKFKKKIIIRKLKMKKIVKNLYLKKKNIIGYGAPAKASTLINYFKIDKFFNYIIDDNPLKNQKYIPNTKIKIINNLEGFDVDTILVFAWNYYDEIKKKNKRLAKNFLKIF